MNKAQVKKIKSMVSSMQEMLSDIETIKDQLNETFDGKSDRWKESEKGEKAQEEISNIEAIDVESIIDALDEIASQYD